MVKTTKSDATRTPVSSTPDYQILQTMPGRMAVRVVPPAGHSRLCSPCGVACEVPKSAWLVSCGDGQGTAVGPYDHPRLCSPRPPADPRSGLAQFPEQVLPEARVRPLCAPAVPAPAQQTRLPVPEQQEQWTQAKRAWQTGRATEITLVGWPGEFH